MALIDNPQAWILRLFEMEEREGRRADCVRFPGGACPEGVPLEDGERVYGIYKGKYHFTPKSLVISDRGKNERIAWADVRSCSSRHGEGKTYSDLTMADGKTVRVRVGDMATGWSGRISQLYHQMIERYGQRPAMGRPLMRAQEFFENAAGDLSFAPNLVPHPSFIAFRVAVSELECTGDGTRVLMDLVDEELAAQALVIVSPAPIERFHRFAETFQAGGVVRADETTLRRVGQVPEGYKVWRVIWD